MDSNRYEAFIAAVDTESMSGAAKRLGYTPSGIIRLINSLEGELGFPLLARSSSGVTPTLEGERMLPIFREICRLEEQVQHTGARIRGLAEGTLTVGSLSSLASTLLPHIIRRFEDRFPNISVDIIGGTDITLRQMLDQHAIDCCLFHGDHSDIDWVSLGKQELVCWMPESSPLTKHSALLLAELDGQSYIRIHTEGETFAEKLLRSRNIEPDMRHTTTDCYTAYCMVAQGLGYTLCGAGTNRGWAKNGVEVRSLSPQQYMEIGIGTLSGMNLAPAVEEFINVAREFSELLAKQGARIV